MTGGGRTGEAEDPWAAVLPGLVLTLAVAEGAARAAHAEAEVVAEEQSRPPRETALLWHPTLRSLWRQGLAACSAEWWVVWRAHAPVLILLTLVVVATHHVLVTAGTTSAGPRRPGR